MSHKITTYVFMDLESTGLPKEELNKTKIIEISLIAVKREHLLNCKPSTMPRVQQKVTLCFNPCRLIDPGATAATGLCNFLLEHEPNFKNGVSILETFFNMLTKPVCLVAYNGLNFDFPLLRNHLEKEKVNIDAELVCADALHCFYDIMKEEEVPPTAIGKAEPTNSMQILNETTPRKQMISAAQRYQHLTYGLITTALLWGATNPFIKRGTKGIRTVQANTITGQMYAEIIYLLSNWQYVIPFVINQCGSLVYLFTLQSSQLSLAVPVTNSLAFIFTAITGYVIGEQAIDKRCLLGIIFVISGTILCYMDNI